MRLEAIPAALLAGLAVGIVVGRVHDGRVRAQRLAQTEAQALVISPEERERGTTRKALALRAREQTTPPAELRRRVAALQSGTYVSDILAQQDSMLYRWPELGTGAIRVFVEPGAAAGGDDARSGEIVRAVFEEWAAAGFPVRIAYVADSTGADISVRWVHHFPVDAGQRIGETERTHSSDALIVRATLLIATHDSAGRPLGSAAVAGTVRHEVGHALGLNHANDAGSVMYRESATTTIGASDRATLRLLYLVPAGSLR